MRRDDLDKRQEQIIGAVWTSPEIYANVERLCDLGSRFSGTATLIAGRSKIANCDGGLVNTFPTCFP